MGFIISKDSSPDGFASRMLQAGLLIDKYYTPLLCLFGTLGNILSLTVFCLDSKHKRQSSSYYLSALAVSDTGFLLNLLAVWLESVQGGVITSSDLMCPLVMYLGQVTCFLSIYLMVAFSIERYVAVHYPLSKPTICTRSKTKKVIFALACTSLLIFSYAWIIAKVVKIPQDESLFGSSENETIQFVNPKVTNWQNGVNNFGPDEDFSHITYNAANDTSFLQWDIPEKNKDVLLLPTSNLEHQRHPLSSSLSSKQQNSASLTSFATANESTNTTYYYYYMCTVPMHYYKISEIANYLDMVITLIIPFILITYLNVSISMYMWNLRGERLQILASSSSSPSINKRTLVVLAMTSNQLASSTSKISVKTMSTPNNTMSTRFTGNFVDAERGRHSNAPNDNGLNETPGNAVCKCVKRELSPFQDGQRATYHPKTWEVKVTKTLLLVSTVFLGLNLPLHVIRCAQFIQSVTGTMEGEEILHALQPWANLLFNTNFAVNFLLYCASGGNFRKSLKSLSSRVLAKTPGLAHL